MKDKTGRLIIKVIFVSFAVIIMFFSSIVLFNTAKGDHVLKITNDALSNKNYSELYSLFGGFYYDKPSVEDDVDDIDLRLIPTYVEKTIYYTPTEGEDTRTHVYHKFLKSYTFFIFDASFQTMTINGKSNQSGVKFISDKIGDNGENVSYIYPFVISATVNTTKTFDQAVSVYDYELNYKRDIISDMGKYGFYNFTLNSETFNAIKEELGGDIIKFNITDHKGNNVFESDFEFAFDFSEEFYNENQGGVIENIYNDYIPYYDSYKLNANKYAIDGYNSNYNNKDTFNTQTEKFNNNAKKFMDDVKAGNVYDSNVKISKTESEIITNTVIAKAVWRTIGIEALVLVVIVVLYILLFHFQQLRDFIFRNDRRVQIRPKVKNVEPDKEQKAKFNYNQSGNNVIDTKPEEIKEEANDNTPEETKENTEE